MASTAALTGEQLQVRFDVEQAQATLVGNKESLVAAQDAVDNAREQLRLAEGRYQAGVGTIIELSDAQVQLTQRRGPAGPGAVQSLDRASPAAGSARPSGVTVAEQALEQAPPPGSPAPAPPRRRRTWIWVGIAVALVLGVVVLRRGKGAANQQPGAAGQARVVPVGVSAAERRDVPIWVEGLGNVTSLATVTVRARVSGQIVSIAFQEGSRVKQGELLVQLDPRPFKIALQQTEATTQRDIATLHNAERDLDRYKELSAQKLIAQQQYDLQAATVESARATVALDQAAVNNARLNLQFSSVTSPIDGIAGVRQVDVGNLVTPTDQNGIVVLTQMDPIAVLFTLPQDDLPSRGGGLRPGAADGRGAGTAAGWSSSAPAS